jgi:protein-tyrosine phosphatase
MGLDYTDGCVNLRDVGEFINLICGEKVLKENQLLRGGSIDYVNTLDEIGNTKSIINLRNSQDPEIFTLDYFHFPMSNKIEKYDTSQKEVRIWLNQIIKTFEDPKLEFPVLVHCLSGKDRTGIVICVILLIIGIEKKIIIEEYLLSEGEVKIEWIQLAIDGIQDVETYFNRVDLKKVRENLKTKLIYEIKTN